MNQRNMDKGLVIVTGASGSMGAAATKALAEEGFRVIMACRNLQKASKVRDGILSQLDEISEDNIILAPLDLCSRESVRAFADSLQDETIDGLFNNAAVLSRDYVLAAEGFERTMSVNYLNTVLLTRLLLPHIKDGGHIVSMVSLTAKYAYGKLGLDWISKGEKDYSQLGTYAASKMALLYFSIALARRCPHLYVNVSDPGVVNSNMITMNRWYDPIADIIFRPFISSPEKGVRPALAALHSNQTLRYFVGNKDKAIDGRFTSNPLVDALWDQAGELLGL